MILPSRTIHSARPGRLRAGFTMVEIALALAIIGFALVAIIGVLPAGLNVQKNNREETIITQDANYLMDAIRSGARGLDALTNNIVSITNYWQNYDTNVPFNDPWIPGASGVDGYTPDGSRVTSIATPNDSFPLTNGLNIMGLLSRPKFDYLGRTMVRSNHVVAIFRSISGAAVEKFPQTNVLVQSLAFTYRLVPEIYPLAQADVATNNAYAQRLQTRLHEVRLKYAWPVLPRGRLGHGRQTFRTLVGGRLSAYQLNGQPVYYFNANTY
ncbi:MAG TPA: type II secretion system protein [Verrucomicrobiota bacterium]|nr:type II secretion system protein [Verrucomicrobiota bacterium]HNT15010.1 type II secretion system protein [Verrucomicrobiota bacterium]